MGESRLGGTADDVVSAIRTDSSQHFITARRRAGVPPVCRRIIVDDTVGDGRSRNLRRARDLMDLNYAPLDVRDGRCRAQSSAHFYANPGRVWRYAYLSHDATHRRAESVCVRGSRHLHCFAVGCTSLGSFSSRFTEIVGETPSQYRARDHRDNEVSPSCVSMVATRPRRNPVTV